jgi:GrpB-like predicted nucleotidyltransferase (UPF0157 family)
VRDTAPVSVRVVLVDYDESWPDRYEQVAAKIRRALGEHAVLLAHVGSTSVPGLSAKPVIDVLLVVADSADEGAYRPALEGAGFDFVLGEPDWFEHRLFRPADSSVNLHVFGVDASEVDAMLVFRDRLRSHPDERARYEQAKRDLAAQPWDSVQDYADAKTDVVRGILARVREAT